MALTGKKLEFAKAVCAGQSNKQAAIDAGYSAATAAQAGSRLAKDKEVAAYVAKHRTGPKQKDKQPPVEPPEDALPEGAVTNSFNDPLDFLQAVWQGQLDANINQVRAATAALPFKHKKLGEGGKKEQKDEQAKKVASRFSPATPPKLVAAGGKKV